MSHLPATPVIVTGGRSGRADRGAWPTRRRVAVTAAVAAGLVGYGSPAGALQDGIGIVKIVNTANGTYASIDNQGYPAPGSGLSASRGDVVKITTWELKANATYALWFIWPAAIAFGVECRYANAEKGTGTIMENALVPGVALKKMKTDAFGRLDRDRTKPGVQAYKAIVPDDGVAQGTAEICAREVSPIPDHSMTQHVRFTIL